MSKPHRHPPFVMHLGKLIQTTWNWTGEEHDDWLIYRFVVWVILIFPAIALLLVAFFFRLLKSIPIYLVGALWFHCVTALRPKYCRQCWSRNKRKKEATKWWKLSSDRWWDWPVFIALCDTDFMVLRGVAKRSNHNSYKELFDSPVDEGEPSVKDG